MKVPNFIFIGAGKSGTTWLFKILSKHHEVYMTPVKETNFFDLNYHRGLQWYRNFFKETGDKTAIGEISHRYIHNPECAERIRNDLGRIKIIIGLREPVDYCISDYLFTKRNGRFDGTLSDWGKHGFDWSTIKYKDDIQPYVDQFGRENIHIYLFDDLREDPNRLLKSITDFLGVSSIELEPEDLEPVNSAARARIAWIARLANIASKWLKRRGGQRVIALVKYSPFVQYILYKKFKSKPQLPSEIANRIKEQVRPHAHWLDSVFNLNLASRWKI